MWLTCFFFKLGTVVSAVSRAARRQTKDLHTQNVALVNSNYSRKALKHTEAPTIVEYFRRRL